MADGDVANAAVVLAKGQCGESLYLVDLAQSGVAREPVNSLDLARSYANLNFESAECELLGEAGEGQQMISDLHDRAAVLFAFEQVGGAEAALDMGRQYTTERFAFGRPVASFQAIKHKLADMFVSKELARSNAYYGAWALSSGAEELPLAAARARVSAIAAYDECSRENIQAHGGMGFTWEFNCHLHYRRAHLLALVVGSGHYWRQLLATRLLNAEV
ncbi:MAG: hypothetical protein HKO07_00655 [Pseudomonadales bacterium]|nr:hypothetical protein [Pseudomonadales bacterium]